MQKQKKQFIIIIVLLILCIGAYLGIRAYNKNAEEKEKAEAEKIAVAEIPVEDITAFSYEYEGTQLSFTKTDGTWTFDGDVSVALNQDAVAAMLSNVESVVAEDEVKDYDDISEYGFDTPQQVLHVKTAEKEYIFTFGMNNSLLSQDYMMLEGDDTVYLVSTTIKEGFAKSIEDLSQTDDVATEAVSESTEE